MPTCTEPLYGLPDITIPYRWLSGVAATTSLPVAVCGGGGGGGGGEEGEVREGGREGDRERKTECV